MRWQQMNSKISVLIPAAGQGSRMDSSVKKPYLMLGDKPILSHTIDRFEQNSVIDEIFVIVDESDFPMCQKEVLTPFGYRKVNELVPGGTTRQESDRLKSCITHIDINNPKASPMTLDTILRVLGT